MKKLTLMEKAETVASNAELILAGASRSRRIIRSQVYELALCAAEEGLSPSDAADMYKDVLGKRLDGVYFALYCGYFCEAAKRSGTVISASSLFPDGTFSAGNEHGTVRVSYVANPYSDKAFRRFRVALGNMEPVPAQSFDSACEDAENGAVDSCILPFFNGKDGVMTSFLRLAARHGLKTAARCTVPLSDGETDTVFALLSPVLDDGDGANMIDVCFRPQDADLTLLLSGAELLGGRAERIDTLPLGYDENDPVTDVMFSFSPEQKNGFFMFLSAEIPHCEPRGIFKMI